MSTVDSATDRVSRLFSTLSITLCFILRFVVAFRIPATSWPFRFCLFMCQFNCASIPFLFFLPQQALSPAFSLFVHKCLCVGFSFSQQVVGSLFTSHSSELYQALLGLFFFVLFFFVFFCFFLFCFVLFFFLFV